MHLSDAQRAQIEAAFPQRRGQSGFERKISMAGVSADVCLTSTSLAAASADREVYLAYDASATWDERAELAAMLCMAQ